MREAHEGNPHELVRVTLMRAHEGYPHELSTRVRSESKTGHSRVDRGTVGWQKLFKYAVPFSGFRVIFPTGLLLTPLLERELDQNDPKLAQMVTQGLCTMPIWCCETPHTPKWVRKTGLICSSRPRISGHFPNGTPPDPFAGEGIGPK